jgi:hypothetical protein
MKKKYFIGATIVGCTLLSFQALTFSSGAPGGNTGSPGDGRTCATAGCHTGGPAQTTEMVTITTDIPADGFLENTDYTITITADDGGRGLTKIGFESLIEDPNMNLPGTLTVIGNDTKLAGGGTSVTHLSSGTATTNGQKSWSYAWNSGTAVDQSTVYASVNFTNSNSATSGDAIITQTLALNKNLGVSLDEAQRIAISAYPNPVSDILTLENVPADVNMINLLDIAGQNVRSFSAGDVAEGNVWTMNVQDLPKGQYFLTGSDASFETIKLSIK